MTIIIVTIRHTLLKPSKKLHTKLRQNIHIKRPKAHKNIITLSDLAQTKPFKEFITIDRLPTEP